MKNIKDLTERDCIHCATQEEFNAILMVHNPRHYSDRDIKAGYNDISLVGEICVGANGAYGTRKWYEKHNYTIHPASDFLTPQVSVLTEIGDCKVIKNGGDVIVMTGNVVITLTPPVLKHIQELLKQQQ